MMGWYGDGMGAGDWLMMTLVMLPFWALLVLGCVALYRSLGTAGHAPRVHRDSAREILERRYARGEIDADEYVERRAQLI